MAALALPAGPVDDDYQVYSSYTSDKFSKLEAKSGAVFEATHKEIANTGMVIGEKSSQWIASITGYPPTIILLTRSYTENENVMVTTLKQAKKK
ncbi:hypothetical protein CHS0354_034919 [Potamilus streckersoni]|uniref:Uncharacterized protein n=1 Tax=Potamilus streckersoni TaxID=2493646 RepID=A0AAE0VTY1_9BIVA|nr:hypothetical protein CHS0354_034919 [Potamilus streckersoni]